MTEEKKIRWGEKCKEEGEKSRGKKQVGLKTRWPRRRKEVDNVKRTSPEGREGRPSQESGHQSGLCFAGPFF